MIQSTDVLNVAHRLGLEPTTRDIQWVLDNYTENDPTATWDLIVEELLYNVPEITIEEFVSSETPTELLIYEEGDIDYRTYSNVFVGKVIDGLEFYNSGFYCGHEHDCCGCVSSITQTAEQIEPNLVKITRTYNYNY